MSIHTQHVNVLIVTAYPKAAQLSEIGPCSDQCLKFHVPVTSALAGVIVLIHTQHVNVLIVTHTSQGGTVK